MIELFLILALTAVAFATHESSGNFPDAALLVLLAGPVLWIYAQVLLWGSGEGRGWLSFSILGMLGALIAAFSSFWARGEGMLALSVMLGMGAVLSSICFWQGVAARRGYRSLERRMISLWAVPLAAVAGSLVLSYVFLLVLFVTIFWLAFYSSALHHMAMVLEQE